MLCFLDTHEGLRDCHTSGISLLQHSQKVNRLLKVTFRRKPTLPSTLGNRSSTHDCDQGPLAGVFVQRAAILEGGAEPIKCPVDSFLAQSGGGLASCYSDGYTLSLEDAILTPASASLLWPFFAML